MIHYRTQTGNATVAVIYFNLAAKSAVQLAGTTAADTPAYLVTAEAYLN